METVPSPVVKFRCLMTSPHHYRPGQVLDTTFRWKFVCKGELVVAISEAEAQRDGRTVHKARCVEDDQYSAIVRQRTKECLKGKSMQRKLQYIVARITRLSSRRPSTVPYITLDKLSEGLGSAGIGTGRADNRQVIGHKFWSDHFEAEIAGDAEIMTYQVCIDAPTDHDVILYVSTRLHLTSDVQAV